MNTGSIGLVLLLMLPFSAVHASPVPQQKQEQGSSSALIVSPTNNSQTESVVNTSGATLFNAQQNVFNSSGNRVDFGDTGCALPTPQLNVAANYGSSSTDLSSISGFNFAVGGSIPLNGAFGKLCREASEIRVALLKTKDVSEKGAWEAKSLITCYEIRNLAIKSQVTTIVLPSFCPANLAVLPPVVTIPQVPIQTIPNYPIQHQPAPRTLPPQEKCGNRRVTIKPDGTLVCGGF
jgi:hypothetical protein